MCSGTRAVENYGDVIKKRARKLCRTSAFGAVKASRATQNAQRRASLAKGGYPRRLGVVRPRGRHIACSHGHAAAAAARPLPIALSESSSLSLSSEQSTGRLERYRHWLQTRIRVMSCESGRPPRLPSRHTSSDMLAVASAARKELLLPAHASIVAFAAVSAAVFACAQSRACGDGGSRRRSRRPRPCRVCADREREREAEHASVSTIADEGERQHHALTVHERERDAASSLRPTRRARHEQHASAASGASAPDARARVGRDVHGSARSKRAAEAAQTRARGCQL